MDITDFANKARLSKRETDVCIKVYKDTEKTEAEWRIELEGKVTFPIDNTAQNKVEAGTETATSDETDVTLPTTKEIARKKVEEIKQNKNKKDE